jgi:hypothetical protein
MSLAQPSNPQFTTLSLSVVIPKSTSESYSESVPGLITPAFFADSIELASKERSYSMQQVEIHIMGQIDRDWSDWLGGLQVIHTADGCTVLSGSIRDQAALYGLLSQLANLGLKLVSLSSDSLDLPVKDREVKM